LHASCSASGLLRPAAEDTKTTSQEIINGSRHGDEKAMDKKIQIVAIVGAIAFSVMVLSSPSDPIPLPEPATISEITSASPVSVVATELDKPRAMAVHGDRVFVTEKEGAVRVIENGTLLERPLAVLRAADAFDGGLLGIDVDPNFDDNGYLYVLLTYEEEANTTTNGDDDAVHRSPPVALWNKVLRITESGNRLADAATILDRIPGSKFTNGGFVKFGPDDKLYIGTGTPSDASHLPQDPESLAGKILRINGDGSVPEDNPFDGSPVYSIGHRNPQGMAWDAAGRMYVAEHGPDKNDEINVVVPGGNYGWPQSECSGDDNGNTRAAILCYDPSIEPGGIAFYDSDRLGLEYGFVMASLRASNLYQIDFEEGLPSQQSILSGVGRVRDVAVHPDGSIYIITSNTDGKGFPDEDDDRLIHIRR